MEIAMRRYSTMLAVLFATAGLVSSACAGEPSDAEVSQAQVTAWIEGGTGPLVCAGPHRSRQFIVSHHWLPIGSNPVSGLGFDSRGEVDRSCRIAELLGAIVGSVRLA